MKNIFNTISIDWFILSRLKSFFWSMILWFLCLVIMLVFVSNIHKFIIGVEIFKDAFTFPIVYNTVSNFAILPAHLISIIQILIICKDFTFKTNRLFITNGKSRNSLLVRCLIRAILLSLFTTIVIFVVSTICGLIYGGEFSIDSIQSVFIFFLQTLCYSIYAIAIATVVKDLGIASFVYIIWFGIIERIIAHIVIYTLRLQILGNIFPGKLIEDKNSLIAIQSISPYHSNWHNPLAWAFTFFWVIFSLWIISNTYKKVHF
ncbi:MAG: hypothetical protein H7339_07730 [Arcicella sp.]|nr:hypothetical protein [Arcicella sp.]